MTSTPLQPRAYRMIACHKHPSSGRLRFIRFATGNICGPEGLPKLAVQHDLQNSAVLVHPAAALRYLAQHLGLDPDVLMFCGDFRLFLEVPHQYAPGGMLPILLVAIAGHRLPVLPSGHLWLELPDSFELPYLEREILRAAYTYLMG